MNLRFQNGITDAQKDEVIALYWQAFGGKLGRILAPNHKALRFVARVLRADQAILALSPEGRVLGLAGFRTPFGGLAGGEIADLFHVYGRLGGFLRGKVLENLHQDHDDTCFFIDGLCVAQTARGQGVGTALIAEIESYARKLGKFDIRLEVVDHNTRAIDLYEKQGYMIAARNDIGALRWLLGFKATFVMQKILFRPKEPESVNQTSR